MRQKRAVDLRLGGVSLTEIATKLNYATEEEVQKDIEAYMKSQMNLIRSDKELLRAEELARLQRLRLALWKLGLDGDVRAISQLLRISELYTKLAGLDQNEADIQITKGRTISAVDIDKYLEVRAKNNLRVNDGP